MERLCLNCSEVLHGRADKKFCNDACRSTYNFDHQDSEKDVVRRTNLILKRNRKILQELNDGPDGKTTVAKNDLSEKGFNFNYHTTIYQKESGDCYFYCYDMGYLILGEKRVLLVIKDNHPRIPFHKKYAGGDHLPAYLNDSEK